MAGATALAKNISLLSLNFDNNKAGEDAEEALEQAIIFNKKAKELQFVERAIVFLQGARSSQKSLLRYLPTDLLLIILCYVGCDAPRKTAEVLRVSRFLIETVRDAEVSQLQWSAAVASTKFFKSWEDYDYIAVKSRYPQSTPNTQLQKWREEDKNYRSENRPTL